MSYLIAVAAWLGGAVVSVAAIWYAIVYMHASFHPVPLSRLSP
jgi:hypothetical protein